MFVDRYKVACNWTRTSATCGANGCVDILATDTSTVLPGSSVGVEGNVFYGFHYGWNTQPSCYYKNASGWQGVGVGNATLTSTEVAKAVTNDPGTDKHNPPLTYVNYAGATQICNSQSTDYGTKRLLRHREYLVASPMPYIYGEPNYFTSMSAFNAPFTTECNPNSTTSAWPGTVTAWLNSSNTAVGIYDTSLARTYNSYNSLPNLVSFIGSSATASCKSRFGMQEPLGLGVLFSDRFIRTNASSASIPQVQGTTNSDDTGAVDHGSVVFDGTNGPAFLNAISAYTGFNYISIYSKTTQYACSTLSTPPPYFIPAVGMPICAWSTSGTQNMRSVAELEPSGVLGPLAVTGNGYPTYSYIQTDTGVTQYQMMSGVYGRFSTAFTSATASSGGPLKYANIFCGVEAE